METLVTILHVLVCVFLMLTVLLQAGKGGGMGAAFGGGSSMGTVFGGSGAGNFLRRLTVSAAVIFMITSMTLAWMATPSTDPLKEYWARQQSEAAERERIHQEAVKGSAGATGGAATTPSTDPAATPGVDTSDEAAEETPSDSTESTAPADSKPATESKAAPAEPKPAAPTESKPAEPPAAESKPAAPADSKPATESKAAPAEPKPETPAKPTPSGSNP
jgi:preprotein translocase subunit SecG